MARRAHCGSSTISVFQASDIESNTIAGNLHDLSNGMRRENQVRTREFVTGRYERKRVACGYLKHSWCQSRLRLNPSGGCANEFWCPMK